jgi:hypothetical protein
MANYEFANRKPGRVSVRWFAYQYLRILTKCAVSCISGSLDKPPLLYLLTIRVALCPGAVQHKYPMLTIHRVHGQYGSPSHQYVG